MPEERTDARDPRIALVIASLAIGGAQRVVTAMATWWAERGRQVAVVTLTGTEPEGFALADGVERFALGFVERAGGGLGSLGSNLRRVAMLRRALQEWKPGVVISFEDTTNVIALLATVGTRVPVLVSERVDPRAALTRQPWRVLRALTYRRAAIVVTQTDAVRRWMQVRTKPDRVVVIPNPVGTPSRAVARSTSESRVVIGLGRLTTQKGFDILIDAFSTVAARHPEWSLVIYGDGDARGDLERQIRALGQEDRFRLPGWADEPNAVLGNADLFVLPSRFEGFPNSLLEAMAVGLPVIATDCPSGPADIVTNGANGILVPPEDVSALAREMERLMSDADMRSRLGRAAVGVCERFSLERVMAKWDHAIAGATVPLPP